MIVSRAIPKVSAIIIVLNGERFIREAIESVLAQTYDDWELLVVDDGSTDGTRDIVDAYCSGDARITLLRHADGGNHGMSATRNLGIAKARGDLIAFLDADDFWLPRKLQDQVAILEAEPETAMVYGRTKIWFSWNENSTGKDYFYDLGIIADQSYPPARPFLYLIDNRFQTPTTCNAMIRRDALIGVGGFDDRFRGMFEDQLVFAKLMALHTIHVSGSHWADYRQHEGSATVLEHDFCANHSAHLRYLRALDVYLRDYFPVTDIRRRRILRKRRLLRFAAIRRSVRTLLGKRAAE
ncbi:glycosyltransferase family 2 protein [Sphingobium phenoxybenzoativorans]|nr:glycosyltransferase family 2 protein [Sphingobium phenoxybenzoativorans]